MAKMKLYYSPSSPYARKVRVVALLTGLDKKMDMVNVGLTPVAPNADVDKHNPIGKIPALSVKGMDLFDSPVICEYLDLQHVGLPLLPREGSARWRRMTLVSQADAIMDAAVSSRYESFLRPEDKRWDGWLQAQGDKIRRSLANLEQEHLPELISGFDLAAIGVACALGYLDLRQPGFGWREHQPGLAAWYAEVVKRPSMVATAPVA